MCVHLTPLQVTERISAVEKRMNLRPGNKKGKSSPLFLLTKDIGKDNCLTCFLFGIYFSSLLIIELHSV